MQLLLLVAQVLFLFAPLLWAAVLSAVVIKLDLCVFAKRPIDAGLQFRGAPLFGRTKTWRGVLVAVVGGASGALVQQALPPLSIALVDYRALPAAWFGALMGLGAMLGELPNSFVKRRLGIDSGQTTRGPLALVFYVWDQVDLLAGAWLMIGCWVTPALPLVVTSVALALFVHPLVSLIGFVIGARKSAR